MIQYNIRVFCVRKCKVVPVKGKAIPVQTVEVEAPTFSDFGTQMVARL
jgi:hypothetical protein